MSIDDTYCLALARPVRALVAARHGAASRGLGGSRVLTAVHISQAGRRGPEGSPPVQRVHRFGLQLGGSPGRPAVKPVRWASSAPLPPRASRRRSAYESFPTCAWGGGTAGCCGRDRDGPSGAPAPQGG